MQMRITVPRDWLQAEYCPPTMNLQLPKITEIKQLPPYEGELCEKSCIKEIDPPGMVG